MDLRKLTAEAIGTFWLTFGGCGSAVIAAGFPHVGIGLLGVSFAFGLTLLTMAYAIGHVSGCHINPAVTLGLAAGGRFPASQIGPYIVAQVVGAIVGAALLYLIASGAPDFDLAKGFAANGYGEHSPGHYGVLSCFVTEVVMTMVFLFIIMGSTHGRAPMGFAPIAIGLGLTLIHLISIPVTNTSVNPARSIGPALFAGGWAISQLWLFIVAPLIGGVLGGIIYRWHLRTTVSASRRRRALGGGPISALSVAQCATYDWPAILPNQSVLPSAVRPTSQLNDIAALNEPCRNSAAELFRNWCSGMAGEKQICRRLTSRGRQFFCLLSY